MTISEKAQIYATNCHAATNHRYDGNPYSFHLQMVVDAAQQFLHLIPEEERENVLAACWVHDCIEDCRQTYNDVKTATNEKVAELAYALTNEKGKTRKERANETYYKGIRETPYATFVKICDRIANATHSRNQESQMWKMYAAENPHFVAKIYDAQYAEMFVYLENLFVH